MRIKRRQIGLILLIISASAFAVARLVSSRPLVSNGWWSGNVGGFRLDITGDLSGLCLGSIIFLGMVGFLCLAWPSRKPPKL